MAILDIPYVNQIEQGAKKGAKDIYNDCGPASGVMLIRAYTPEKTFTVEQFYDELGFKKDQPLSYYHIQQVLEKHGISSDRKSRLKLSHLEAFIKEKRPPIVLFNYKVLRQNKIKTQNTSALFHWAVLVGVDDAFVYLNDPLWSGTKGKNFQIPHDIWLKAWGGESFLKDNGKEWNQQFQAIIPDYPVDIEDMKLPEGSIRMKVIFDDYMNVRSGAGTNNKAHSKIPSGANVTILETKTDGADVWGRLGPDRWVAIQFRGDTYLEPVLPSIDSQEETSSKDDKDEFSEENKMSDKKSVIGVVGRTDDVSEETDQNQVNPALGAIMAELKEIKAMLKEMKKNMASGNLEIVDQTEDEQITEEPVSTTPREIETPEKPEEPEDKYVEKEVYSDNKRGQVFLSYAKDHNDNQKPMFQFYPRDTAKVSERVFVKSGTKLKFIPESRVVGDGGVPAWKLDMNEYIHRMKGSARVPGGIQLVVLEKFIKQ